MRNGRQAPERSRAATYAITLMVAGLAVAVGFVVAGPASAGGLAATERTPMGAEKAGNEAGTIPAWEGGLRETPAGVTYDGGGHYPDPYAGDKPLFRIDAAAAEQHGEALSEGHKALLKRYPAYTMAVYPSRRTCAFPERVYRAMESNRANARLAEGGLAVANAAVGPPFPVPESGIEAVWNHLLRFRAHTIRRQFAAVAPAASGDYTPIIVADDAIFPYAVDRIDDEKTPAAEGEAAANGNAIALKYLQQVLSPSRRAGVLLLIHDTMNHAKGERQAWTYSPGARRVMRAPQLGFDTAQAYSDGLATADNYDLFNGSPEKYDWKLVGKRELIVPYNTYRLASPDLAYDDIIRPGHINQDHVRYERHRVWVVDATLKDGERHVYSRRVMYLDEDSWNILVVDLYDVRGGLRRVQEAHLQTYWDVPTCFNESEIVYDLAEARYVMINMKNEETGIRFNTGELTEDDFDPNSLRRRATR